jgi:hypothetical protein
MPASVAPAEDADLFLLQLAQDGGAAASFLFLEMSLFHTPHAVLVLSFSVPGTLPLALANCYENERKKNITGTFSVGQAEA